VAKKVAPVTEIGPQITLEGPADYVTGKCIKLLKSGKWVICEPNGAIIETHSCYADAMMSYRRLFGL
jgi:hypothetical protein